MWQLPSLLSVVGPGIDAGSVQGISKISLCALGKAGIALKPDCFISSLSSDGPWFSEPNKALFPWA